MGATLCSSAMFQLALWASNRPPASAVRSSSPTVLVWAMGGANGKREHAERDGTFKQVFSWLLVFPRYSRRIVLRLVMVVVMCVAVHAGFSRFAVWQLCKDGLHPQYLGGLVSHDMAGEVGHDDILGCARLAQQFIHHQQCAFVVMDHTFQKQLVELCPVSSFERTHLVGRQHPGHQRDIIRICCAMIMFAVPGMPVMAMMGVQITGLDRLTALEQPVSHHLHLVILRECNASAHGDDGGIGGASFNQRDHVDRLLVMDNHVLHEARVCGGMACLA